MLIQRPWARQPSGGVPLLRSGLGRGIVCAYQGARALVSLTDTAPLNPINGYEMRAGPYGVGLAGVVVSPDRYFELPASLATAINASGEATCMMLMQGGTAADQGFGYFGSSASLSHYPFGGLIYLAEFGTSRWVNGVASMVDLTRPHSLVLQFKNGSQRATQNGLVLGTASAAVAASITGTPLLIASQVGSSYSYQGAHPLVVFWDRYLADAEVTQLHRNPWQLLAPLPRRMWAPAVASGIPTLSAATVTAITATTATPRVTITF
jgi:hypothetical protein